jgi:uncharacterized Zn finger protein (UPF0148 family)
MSEHTCPSCGAPLTELDGVKRCTNLDCDVEMVGEREEE